METNLSIVRNQQSESGICSSFLFDDHDVRVQNKSDGKVLFVARDVVEALGLAWDGNRQLSKIPDDWKGVGSFPTPGGNQELQVVTEPAVYKLAFRSNKEGAERFTNWVASQVLPSVRKTGKYSVGQHSLIPKSVAEEVKTCLQIAKPYHSLAKLFGCSKSTAAALTAQFVKRTTGRDMSDLLIENKATVQDPLVTPTEIANELGYPGKSGNKANKILAGLGLQNHVEYLSSKGEIKKRWELTEEGKKLAQIYDTGKLHSDGVPIQQVKWYKSKTLELINSSNCQSN